MWHTDRTARADSVPIKFVVGLGLEDGGSSRRFLFKPRPPPRPRRTHPVLAWNGPPAARRPSSVPELGKGCTHNYSNSPSAQRWLPRSYAQGAGIKQFVALPEGKVTRRKRGRCKNHLHSRATIG